MLKVEIIQSISEVNKVIIECDLIEMIGIALNGHSKDNNLVGIIFKTHEKYVRFSSTFSDSTKKIMMLFNLTDFDDPKFWTNLLTQNEDTREKASYLRRSMHYITDYLPNIMALMMSENLQSKSEEKLKETKNDIITVNLPEENNMQSSAVRVRDMIDSICILFDACSTINHIAHHSPVIISCDSGSDKSFDFLGAAKVIECIKEIILTLWDRIIFYREKKVEQRISLICQGLPILEKISDMREANSIGPEQAEILKRNIMEGITKFIDCGAIIPEIENSTVYNPRLLMAPAPKLLEAPAILEKQTDGKGKSQKIKTNIKPHSPRRK